jgi:hypothetical protein
MTFDMNDESIVPVYVALVEVVPLDGCQLSRATTVALLLDAMLRLERKKTQ